MPAAEEPWTLTSEVLGDEELCGMYRQVILLGGSPGPVDVVEHAALYVDNTGAMNCEIQRLLPVGGMELLFMISTLSMTREQIAAQPVQAFEWPGISDDTQIESEFVVAQLARAGLGRERLPLAILVRLRHAQNAETVLFMYPPDVPGDILLRTFRRLARKGYQ